jgi:ribonuclease HI
MRGKINIYTDGGARGNPGISGAGIFVSDEDGLTLAQEAVFLGHKTNNEAEYLALEYALGVLESKSLLDQNTKLFFYLDSKLVVEQLSRRWKIKEHRLLEIALRIWQRLSTLPHAGFSFTHVPREQNKIADQLANQAMDQAQA